jgi:hypothetical protein
MSASVVTTHCEKSGPGGGIGGNAPHVDGSDIDQSRPTPMWRSPNVSTSPRNAGAEATATSCPAPASARATGTSGWR